MQPTAIIGAGVAGLAAAVALTQRGFPVEIFEKSRGVSGRAATRRREGAAYDHGAQYFRTDTPVMRRLIHETLPTEGLVDIGRRIDTFDREGSRSVGDQRLESNGKWTYTEGISRLGKLLAAHAGVRVRRNTRIEQLEGGLAQWRLRDDTATVYGPYAAVLVTAPGPQAAELVQRSRFDENVRLRTVDVLRASTYRTILSLILCVDRVGRRDESVYALVNTDREHPVSWLAFEEDKPGRVPQGRSLVIAQMSDAWSRPRFRWELEDLIAEGRPHVEGVLGHALGEPFWYDKQGWLYALPNQTIPSTELDAAGLIGLYFAGDAFAEGRVHQALENGFETGVRVAIRLAAG